MKDTEFIELLNLYVDREITADDAARLESEVLRDQGRRAIYLQYCRMQKACTLMAAPLAESSASSSERSLAVFEPRRRWTDQIFPAALAAAACLALLFVVRAYRSAVIPAQGAPMMAQTAEKPAEARASGEAFTPVFSARQDALLTSDDVAAKQFDWLGQIHIAPVQQAANADQFFAFKPELKPVVHTLQAAPVDQAAELTAFQIHQ